MLRSRELLAATLAGSLLFFAFQGAFSYIGFRLEREPFSLSDGATGLVFLVWAIGAIGPTAGRVADRRGWSIVALAGLATAAAGIGLSLAHVLPLVLLGLALVTLGNFGGITAAQLGVASSTASDRGLASALYFSSYYLAGALGAWAPGLAWEAWGWDRRRGALPRRLRASARRGCCSRGGRRASASPRPDGAGRGRTARRSRARRARPCGRAAASAPRGRAASGPRPGSACGGRATCPATPSTSPRGRRARRRRRRPPRASPSRARSGPPGPDPSSSASRAGAMPASHSSASSVWAPEIPPQIAKWSSPPFSDAGAGEWSLPISVEVAEPRPERVAVGRPAQRRRALRDRAEPLGVVGAEHEVVRAGLARHVDPARPRGGDQRDAAPGRDVDDVERAAGLLREQDRAADRLQLGDDRARGEVVAHRHPAGGDRPCRERRRERVALRVDRDRQPQRRGAGHAVEAGSGRRRRGTPARRWPT